MNVDFEQFWEGYLLGLAFTATKGMDGEPLFNNPGGDIAYIVDLKQFQIDMLENGCEEKLPEMREDCLDFFNQAHHLMERKFKNAGSDFHLTRNGHGSGFWDGDWEHGDELTDLSKPYGTCELVVEGDSYYIHN